MNILVYVAAKEKNVTPAMAEKKFCGDAWTWRVDPFYVRHDGDAAFRVLKHAVVAGCPDVAPARVFQGPDQVANLDCHDS